MHGTWEARAARRTSTYSPGDKHLSHRGSMGRGNVVGIAPRHGLDGPVMESI